MDQAAEDGTPVGHMHVAHEAVRFSRRAIRLSVAVIVPAAVVIVAAMTLLWPRGGHPVDSGGGSLRAWGQVRSVEHRPCPDVDPAAEAAGMPSDCGNVQVQVTDGPGRGTTVTTEVPAGPGAVRVEAGDRVVLIITRDDPAAEAQYQIIDEQRGLQLWVLVACFAAAVIAFGRWRGLTALAGLGVTFGVLLYFIVPAILAGRPPLLVAITGSAAIMLAVLFLTHGFNAPTEQQQRARYGQRRHGRHGQAEHHQQPPVTRRHPRRSVQSGLAVHPLPRQQHRGQGSDHNPPPTHSNRRDISHAG
jgi:hypothetical protein